MRVHRLVVPALACALAASAALAQGTQSSEPNKSPPAAAAPSAPAKPATTGATNPVAAKVNLNTATEAALDKLPKMTPAHAKAIVTARQKAKFKNWDDFAARKVIPAGAAAVIKDSVTF